MRQLTLIFMLFILVNQLWGNEFNEKQKAIIYTESIKVLQAYQDLSNQMADAVVDVDQTNKLSQSIIDLYVNRKAIIYNDLDPSHKLSEAYELETYINNITLWYPDGMKFTFDFKNLKAGNIIDHGNDIYTVDLMTSKKIDGNYLNKQKNELTEQLLYRIAFFQKGNAFENFKIAGVRSSSSTTIANDANILAEVKSVTFSEKDMDLIKDQTKALLNDYINFINLLADPKESNDDKGYYRISFLGLFKDSTLNVANDIEPNAKQRWVSVAEYEKNLVSSYPEGIRNLGLNLDSAQYGKIIPEGTDKYYVNGYIDKFFSGKYQDKIIHRDNAKYDFKVSFERDENTFKNFKLTSIDKFGVNLYNTESTATTNELPSLIIEPIGRKGLQYGLEFFAGSAIYKDPNLLDNQNLDWSVKSKPYWGVKLKGIWYLNGYVGVSGALGYSHTQVTTTLNGDFQNSTTSSDYNNEQYYKLINTSIDSNLNINYFDIPISLIFHSNPSPEKWSIFAEIGINTGLLVNSNYEISGHYATSGYYYQRTTPQYINDPTYGFVDKTIPAEKKNVDLKSMNISLISTLGVTYPLDYFTTIYFGLQYNKGLTNLTTKNSYVDYLGNNLQAEKRTLSNFGVKFGINYKF